MCYQIIIIYLIYFIFIEFRVVGRLIHLQLSVCIAKWPADARQKKTWSEQEHYTKYHVNPGSVSYASDHSDYRLLPSNFSENHGAY